MTTKNTTTITDPHALAEAAVERWRAVAKGSSYEAAQNVANLEAVANAEDDNEHKRALTADMLVARIAFFEAEDAERVASFHASLALEAIEPEDGTDRELLGLCGVRQLRDRLAESLALEARLQSEFQEVMRRRHGMVGEAAAAHATLTTRRAAAGLPAPLPIPADPGDAEAFLEALSRPPTPPESANTWILKRCRADEVELRAGLERARRAKEAEAKRRKEHGRATASESSAIAKENAANMAAWNAEREAARDEERKLAEAHRKGAA